SPWIMCAAAGDGSAPDICPTSAIGAVNGVRITVAGSTPSAGLSTVTASPACVVSNGTSASTITVTVRDSSGNPIPGVIVSLSRTPASSSAVTSPASQVTNASGVATFTAVDTSPETVRFTAAADGIAIQQAAVVRFDSGTAACTPDASRSTINVSSACTAT